MKIRSLLLGSIAAAGLSTAGYAADLGVVATSLDVCDALGISGLTISSDTTCLQISGGVTYQYQWGDFRASGSSGAGSSARIAVGFVPFDGNYSEITEGGIPGTDYNQDWVSKIETYITAVATSESDFGKAQAVITIKQSDIPRYWNENYGDNDGTARADGYAPLYIDEAYVSVGDSTVIMAGRKKQGSAGSVANLDDDNAFTWKNTFISGAVDGGGVLIDGDVAVLGGDSIQVLSDLGNGVKVGVGLENLDGQDEVSTQRDPSQTGSIVGVVSYAGSGVTAHLTGAAVGFADGDIGTWFAHAGATGTFDAFRLRAALAYLHQDAGEVGISNNLRPNNDRDAWHGLITGSATFDLFTIALAGEYASDKYDGIGTNEAWGVSGSVAAQVVDGVSINLGARYLRSDATDFGGYDEGYWQVALGAAAAITETVSLSAEIGAYYNSDRTDTFHNLDDGLYYGSLGATWKPSDTFSTGIKGEANNQGAYRLTFDASKSFK